VRKPQRKFKARNRIITGCEPCGMHSSIRRYVGLACFIFETLQTERIGYVRLRAYFQFLTYTLFWRTRTFLIPHRWNLCCYFSQTFTVVASY